MACALAWLKADAREIRAAPGTNSPSAVSHAERTAIPPFRLSPPISSMPEVLTVLIFAGHEEVGVLRAAADPGCHGSPGADRGIARPGSGIAPSSPGVRPGS